MSSTAGPEAIQLAAECGLLLDPWQQDIVNVALAERADASLAASTAFVICSRQNGKNGFLEAVELHDLVLAGAWLIHTAHLFPTAREAFNRLVSLVESHKGVKARLTKKYASPMSGYELHFKGGGKIRFIARSRTSGRGLTGDKLILDESQDLNDEALGALVPTISARPGSQTIYTGSAPSLTSPVSQRLRSKGRRIAEAVKRGEAPLDPNFAYWEFSASPGSDLDDRAAWADANPALGTRITEAAVMAERASMSDEMFARERLSISPEVDELVEVALPGWAECATLNSSPEGRVAIAVDVTPDRMWASIAAAGRRADGSDHVELVDHMKGTARAVERLVELHQRWDPVAVALDPAGPAGSLLADLERAGVAVTLVSAREHASACGALHDAVTQRTLAHLDDGVLNAAVLGAKRRQLGDAWAWDRKRSDVDISPLVAVTLAKFAFASTVVAEPQPFFVY
jgi:phage terminase large subunit-like protein